MADQWLVWCATRERDALLVRLRAHDRDAVPVFVDSAQELRRRAQEAEEPVGAMVGLVDGGVSAINAAAAVARDGVAREVVLVVRTASDHVLSCAKSAHVDKVIALDAGDADLGGRPAGYGDLDEPGGVEPDVPTMVMLVGDPSTPLDGKVPRVEEAPPPPAAPQVPVALGQPDASTSSGASLGFTEVEVPWKTELSDDAGAPVVTFLSGRGGVGKTSLVATMAKAATTWGMRVALLDLDLTSGNLYDCLGLPGPADLAALLEHESPSVDDVLSCARQTQEGITLLGGCELPEMAESVMPRVERVVAVARSGFDLVLVDTSVALTDAVAQAAQSCDRLAIVVDGRPGSAAAQRRLGSLCVRLGVARTRVVRIANRCGPRGRGEPQINRADIGLEAARPLRVMEGGLEVTECLSEGRPGELFDLGSRFAVSSASALASMLAELGRLPDCAGAREALEQRPDHAKWGFGLRRGA